MERNLMSINEIMDKRSMLNNDPSFELVKQMSIFDGHEDITSVMFYHNTSTDKFTELMWITGFRSGQLSVMNKEEYEFEVAKLEAEERKIESEMNFQLQEEKQEVHSRAR